MLLDREEDADKDPPSTSATGNILRRLLLENAVDKWRNYVLAFGLLFLASGATAASAYIMQDVVNEIFVNRRKDQTFLIAGAIAAVFIVKGVASYGGSVLLARTGNAIIAGLQRRMYDAVLSQDLEFFELNPLSSFVMRIQNSANACREVISILVMSVGRDACTLLSLVGVMIHQDPFMSLMALVVAPPAVLGVMYLIRQTKKFANQEFTTGARLVDAIKETVFGIKVVKTYTLENRMTEDFSDSVAMLERRKNALVRIGALTVPLMEALAGITIALVIVYGGLGVIDGDMEPGAFFSFITALLMAWDPARRLARVNVTFHQSMVGVRRVYQTLDMIEARSEHNSGPDLVVRAGAISFENVTFAYEGGKDPALKDLSLDFAANEITALVGPSGGGKSTALSLINRLRAPDAGRILIDGTDIAAASAKSLRVAVAYVAQDSFLFDMPIRDNIRVARPDATDAEVEAAARAANAHGFILEQPQGYETRVGEGGGLISGGQRQRIAIARAVLADSPIILLDEATSALDNASERKVQQALQSLMRGRTTVVIAHRLTTIRNANTIHVIDGGRCVETGSHEELIAADGLYRHLHDIQFSDAPADAD